MSQNVSLSVYAEEGVNHCKPISRCNILYKCVFKQVYMI